MKEKEVQRTVIRGNRALTGIMDYFKAYYRVCRLEYAPGEIPAIFTVLFLGSASVSRFFALPVIEALVAFILLYLSGFIINAITDKEIDKKYDTFKTSIPKSVDIFGESTLKAVIIGHVAVAIILAFHITLQMGSIVPIALVLIGVFFGLGYSAKPFHFKIRGIWHGIALGSSAFFLPFIFLMFVIAEGLTLPLLAFIVGFSFVHYGMEFGNQAIDYIEDKASNVKTPPVRWGMIPSLIVALGCVVFGILAEGISFYYILLSKGSFTFIHPVLTTNVVYVVLMSIILAGYYIPTRGLLKMLFTLRKSKTVEEGMPTLKKICNYAKWQTSGIMGVAIVSGLLFFSAVFGPAAQLYPGNGDTGFYEGNLKITSEPEVEFYKDDGDWKANVSVSVLNNEIERQMGSLMIKVESWTANDWWVLPELLLLEKTLKPYEYWNKSTQINAHDVDDTTIKIFLYELVLGQSGDSHFKQVGEPWIELSQKDLYIFDVKAEEFEDVLHDKKANVTVTVFNEGEKRFIGDLEVKVTCFTSYWKWADEESEKNAFTVNANEYWPPTIKDINVIELDIDEPIFVIKLLDKEGRELDDYTLFGYS